ncbi:MAG: bifunctional (p)ppGpp synthetase/guanosine-3',5'-bis(diphosphate) 3'-pyrophosphohydrolase [Verrucomicrobia bacterium]|nr:bifunctional (p)ppGpp synthetase/guanosine-3',5'-bis(diphosphate) 3'-pyrophosphohydrolase [Verrucomicrobiota bacterium]
MKKNILPFLAALTMAASGLTASEEKPKVSICQTEECDVEDSVQCLLEETKQKLAELAHNDKVVMKNFETLADVLNNAYHKEKSMTAHEVQEICAGVEFAAEKHRLQTRKNPEKTPYISHPIGVANNLMEIGEVRDSAVILGALLHDTVEDTQTTFEEIENKFGKQVANLVREVTDDKSLAKEARKRLQVINASHKSKGAAQIKLADKLYNLNDLLRAPPADWTQTRIDRYYEWAQSVVDRLPKANDKLSEAVDDVINTYWEKQQASK